MSGKGLNEFVRRNEGHSPDDIISRRQEFQSLKIPLSKPLSKTVNQQRPVNASVKSQGAEHYAYPPSQDNYRNSGYTHHHHQETHQGFDDSSVSDDFENTITSDRSLKEEDIDKEIAQRHHQSGYGHAETQNVDRNSEDGEFDDDQEQMTLILQRNNLLPAAPNPMSNSPNQLKRQDRSISSEMRPNQSPSKHPSKSGRFDLPETEGSGAGFFNVALRPGDNRSSVQNNAPTQDSSKKRSHSGEPRYSSSHQQLPDDTLHKGRQMTQRHEATEEEEEYDEATEVAESESEVTHQNINSSQVDYDDQELSDMAYAELKEESWDREPESHDTKAKAGEDLKGRFDYYTRGIAEKYISGGAKMTEKDIISVEGKRKEYFASLTIDDWEETGDMFVDRFGELLKAFKDARKKKRNIASAYEDQIEEREALVRGKSDWYSGKLNDIREGGRNVLSGMKY